MSDPDIDLEDRNLIGGIDVLVTNFALAIIAVAPTLGAGIAMPWKLTPQISRFEADGRRGMLLSPGVFLALALTFVLLLVAMFTTKEILEWNGSLLGPGLAVRAASAAQEGNLWKVVSVIAPVYLLAVGFGTAGSVLNRWTVTGWTLTSSLRASFYVTAVIVSWIVVAGAIIDMMTVQSGNRQLGNQLYSVNSAIIFGLPVWIYYWFYKEGGKQVWWKAFVLAVAMTAILFAFGFGVTLLLMQI